MLSLWVANQFSQYSRCEWLTVWMAHRFGKCSGVGLTFVILGVVALVQSILWFVWVAHCSVNTLGVGGSLVQSILSVWVAH
ncbi:hypothetical protein J6590_078349 [Homalodisca vitripennis]|nr:hypothetical protein J6590_078349 [Homalodisca vitripennis]